MRNRYNSFPVYRHYADRLTWFRVDSPSSVYELKRMGIYFSMTHIEAKLYPERVFINDLIECAGEHIMTATAEEFEQVEQQWEQELVKREL